ncbi:MAG: nucleoside-diphosphate-sugar epimerase [Myxococcota bacterium]|jgi:nucleoside-diphosphate-sugar epimerase
MSISIRETYRNKNVMVTGCTGFLGKVLLTMLLDQVEDVGLIYVLIRKRGLRSAAKRFEKIVNSSPAFRPLHERFGAGLSGWLSERVEIVQGDISQPDFGIDAEVLPRIQKDLDVVINCAGLVDFNPDMRLALGSNVDGPLSAAEFAAGCDDAGLVHVSTCYVVGNRAGRIEETIDYGYTPKGKAFDPEQELLDVAALVERVLEERRTPEAEAELASRVAHLIEKRGLDGDNETLVRNMMDRTRNQQDERALADIGMDRAEDWGWPNTYTWSKSIGEQLLQKRGDELGLNWCVLRPSIVESSLEFPFAGWNEGFNTCGPLVYLLGTWFKDVPSQGDYPFDVIPVDLVCKGLMTAGAATMLGEQQPVYHCGSSDLHQISVGRAIELTALGHRRHLRKHGETAVERLLLSRWDGNDKAGDHVLSLPNIRKTASGLEKLFRKVPSRFGKSAQKQAAKVADGIKAADKGLGQVEKITELFKPFIHDSSWVFEARGLVGHDVIEDDIRFDPASINWRTWWLDVHMPGLRKWSFPQFQGKPVPTFKPQHKFKLHAPGAATGGVRAAAPNKA